MPVKQGSGIRKSGRVFGQGQKTAKMVRAGLYARVSTQDQQTLPMQNRAMREYAVRRGWTVAMQVKEVGSGALQRQQREKLLEAARRREIDVVVVWRLDRPLTAGLHAGQVRKLHRSGLSKSEISRRLNIGRTSVRRILYERTGS